VSRIERDKFPGQIRTPLPCSQDTPSAILFLTTDDTDRTKASGNIPERDQKRSGAMNGKNASPRRTSVVWIGLVFATILVWALVFNVEARANSGPAADQVDPMETQPRVSAPLKPAWVEEFLDARATALRVLLEASDLHAVAQRTPVAQANVPGSAPLKPAWVEEFLDARATALRALLEAHDLLSARQ
jgi:hypothetical protein